MQLFTNLLALISALSFIVYGCLCVFTEQMTGEFERYRLSSMRKMIGCLEIAGGIGILVGFSYHPLLTLSTSCLALLMICALLVRISIRDPFVASIPAIILFFINFYISLS